MEDMTLEELEGLVLQWAEERGLTDSDNLDKQTLKLMEEVGELASAVIKNKEIKILDGLGDSLVVLTILCAQFGVSLMDAYKCAWMEIRDRKGKTVNGVFRKEK